MISKWRYWMSAFEKDWNLNLSRDLWPQFIIFHQSLKFDLFWDFWSRVTFYNLETPFIGQLTSRASFCYTIHPRVNNFKQKIWWTLISEEQSNFMLEIWKKPSFTMVRSQSEPRVRECLWRPRTSLMSQKNILKITIRSKNLIVV